MSQNPFIKDYNTNAKEKVLLFRFTTDEKSQEPLTQAFVENGFCVRAICFNKCQEHFGHDALQEILKTNTVDFQPNWIHMQLQFFEKLVEVETMAKIRKLAPKAIITNSALDIREIAMPYFVKISKYVNKSLICSEGQIQMYKEAGCSNVDYWQVGVDPNTFFRMPDNKRTELNKKYGHDIVFCANRTSMVFPGTKFRQDVVNVLNNTYRKTFRLYGRWIGTPNKRLPFLLQNEVYNASKFVISVNNFNNVYKYFSKRQLIAMSTGTCTVSVYIPGMEEYFTHGEDILWFKDTDELVRLINYYLVHDEERETIGKRGRETIIKHHSYYQRVRELATRLGFQS